MKHDTHIIRQGITCLSLVLSLALCGALTYGAAQQQDAEGSAKKQKSEAKQQAAEAKQTAEAKPEPDAKEQKAASVKGQKTPRAGKAVTARASAGEHDPFGKYRVIIKRVVRNVPVPVTPPSIQSRIERYKDEKRAAMNMQQPAPKPTTALLLGEMQVIGIFRTPRGYAAMVEATPIKLSYTIYPGERFYDGQLVAIEEDRLVFRRETRWTDGRLVRAVETKPLRQPSVVADPLSAVQKDSAGKAEEKAASPDKQ